MDANPYKSPAAHGGAVAPPTIATLTLPLTFAYHFGPESLLRWNLFYSLKSPAGRRQRSRVIKLFVLTLLMAAAIPALLSRNWIIAVFAFGIASILSLVMPGVFQWRLSKTLKAHLNSPQFAGDFGPHRLTLSDSGLRETMPTGERFVKWPFVFDVAGEGDHVFIMLANGGAFVIERESYAGPIPFESIVPVVRRLTEEAKTSNAEAHA